MTEQQNPEQVTPSAEPQPQQPPQPVAPEQPPAPEPQQPPAGDPNETTDAGDGAGDQPTADEQTEAGDVTEPAPPENEHAGDAEGSPGLGVTGKFVHDEPAGDEGAGDQ